VIGSADAALYRAKKEGGGQLRHGTAVDWPLLPG